MKRSLLVTLLIVFSLVFAGISFGGTTTGTLQVTATVASVCTVSTTPVNFGTLTPGSSGARAYGDVTVNCPINTAYNIALDYGLNYNPNTLRRNMSDGQNSLLQYRLLQPDDQTSWGDSDFANTYPDGVSFADTGAGQDQSHTVIGQHSTVPSVPAGTVLTDTVTVTVHY